MAVIEGFNWLLNLSSPLNLVLGWVRRSFSVKMIAFLAIKAVLFYLFYKYLPHLFGKFYQWIYDLGIAQNMGIDLPTVVSATVMEITGLAAWLFYQFKLDTCLQIIVAAGLVRLSVRSLPFFGR